jgi:uncharacterized membrane protein YhiD involved in acid resistance
MTLRLKLLFRSSRFWSTVAALSWVSAAVGWASMGYGLWVFTVMSIVTFVAVVTVEETRVSEAHRESKSAHKRECHHGSSSFQAYPGDDAERAKVGRRTR